MMSAPSVVPGRQWSHAWTCVLGGATRSARSVVPSTRSITLSKGTRPRRMHIGAGGGSGSPPASGGGGGGGGDDRPRSQNVLALTTALYAALVTSFGYLGYKKRGSRQSLVTSATAAGCLLLAALMTASPGWQRLGLLWGAGACAGLATVMGQRWAASRSFMPAGAVTSSAALLGLAHLCAVVL